MTHPIASLINETLESELCPPVSSKFPGAVAFIEAKEADATDSLAILFAGLEQMKRFGTNRYLAHERAIQR